MNNYNINVTKKKKVGNLNKTTINIVKKDKKSMSLKDIKAIVTRLNNTKNEKYHQKFIVIASTPFLKNFNMKAYTDDNIRYDSIEEYLDGRVKDTTKLRRISQISITMIKERI